MPQILMPALSPTMEEGKLAKWLVKVGDTVAPGDVLAEIETDKATMEVEAVDSGTVQSLMIDEGTEGVKVNTPIALVLGEGEELGEATKSAAQATSSDPEDESAAPQRGTVPAEPKSGAAEAPKFVAESDPELPEGVEMVEMTVRQALNEAMAEELRRDKDVFIMGEEVAQYQGAYKITQNLLEEFGPERVVDTPITEHGFAGLAVGAAFAGLKPVVEFMTFNFAMQAIDQIINSAAKQLYMSGGQVTAPMVFRGPNGPAARVGAQHSQDFSAWYAHVPGLTVVAPYSAADAKGLLKSAIRSPNPVVFLENEILYGSTGLVPKMDDFLLPIGKARVARTGADVTIVSFSMGMRYATQATEKLVAAGVDVELIDLRTLRPMDSDTVIESVKKTGRLVTVEEGWPQGGIGAELSARVSEQAFDYLDAPVIRVTGKDVPMPYAANLEKLALPNVDEVIAAVNAVTYRS
ncbi:pyruvate dehydrogenase complex E1 component subunit beta [Devosia sp. RR2S18]|uniref:pyruvate dehydrogenase complex E1 component subunit beta n=1 Tax=Devosia rhizosphaerae TaxID=3049774 RepID=UPI0025424CB7|nr:pyruvate dehydrogenase complex E1 component subunit beta [Devosia sp. RR2S18]WIJ23629.1 pyruvate dehydrogenase complex E1 component subunit beta [Devosia sp. RR2S18]